MKKLLFLLLAAWPLFGSTVSVTVVGTTPQQAILDIRASDNSACTVQVSENASLTPSINDVSETLFPGSSSCGRRGSIVSGNEYRMTIGFRGTATATGTSSDGLIYSRSLQAYTAHYVKVTLASGATAIAAFTTENPPLGNSAPDYIPFNANGYGNYGWPSQHFGNTLQVDATIDPLTGFQMNRITGPGMGQNDTTGTSGLYVARDNSGGGWTTNCVNSSDSSNIYQSPQSTNYCTYTGAGGVANSLFLLFRNKESYILNFAGGNNGEALPGGINASLGDLKLNFNGKGDNLQACLSMDGSTCLANPITLSQQSTDTTQSFPSTWPEPPLKEWNNTVLPADFTVSYGGSITLSGNSVTITDTQGLSDQTPLLPPWVKVGGSVLLTDYKNYYDLFSISSIADAHHFTFSGTVPAGHSYTSYALNSGGLLVWKATGGTGSTNIGSMNSQWSSDSIFTNGVEGNSSGSCDSAFQLGTDASGNAITPISAKTCSYLFHSGSGWGPNISWLWSPTTGEVRVYDLASSARSGGWNYNGSTGYLSYCNYDNTFLGVPYGQGTGSSSHFSCSTPNTTYTILQEIKAAHPEVDLDYWTAGGKSDGLAFRGENDNAGHQYAIFTADAVGDSNYGQNNAYWEFVLDLSQTPGAGQVIGAYNSWAALPWRFATTHYQAGPYLDGFITGSNGASHVATMISMGGPNTGGVGAGNSMVGQYGMQVLSVMNNTSGAVASTYAESCAADGVTNPQWLNEEPTDNDCYQVKVASEPVNETPPTGAWFDYPNGDLTPYASSSLIGSRPGPWKHNATSCAGGAGDNTTSHCYSYLVDSQEGDWVIVATVGGAGSGNWANDNAVKNEIDLIAKKTVNGDGTISFVLVRGPKDDFGNSNINPLMNIPAGFVLDEIIPGNESDGYFPIGQTFNKQNFLANLPIVSAHQDTWSLSDGTQIIVSTNDYRQYIRTMGESFAVHQLRNGILPGVLLQGWTNQSAEYHPFDPMPNPNSNYYGDYPGLGINAPPQSYTQYHPGGNPYAATGNDKEVAFDASPFGGSQGGADGLWSHSYSLVSGQSHTYTISDPAVNAGDGYGEVISTTPDPKRRETMAWAGPELLQNISGPGSVISDTTPYSYCRALIAGECVAGSTVGQSYVSVPNADLDGVCKISLFVATPCFTPVDPHHNYVYEFSIQGNDPFGLNWRNITMGYAGPSRHNNYWNAHGDPSNRYVYVQGDELDGSRQDIFAVKLPPYPSLDGIRRDTFLQMPVQLAALANHAANTVRIRFGYAEYGLDGNNQPLFCSSERREDCSTGTPPVATDPYAWLSENPTWQDCTSGCTVNLPAISGRVLYYVVDRKNGGTTTVGPMQSIAVQ